MDANVLKNVLKPFEDINFMELVSATISIPVSDADGLSVRFSTSPGVIRQVLGEMTVEGSTSINQGLNNDDHELKF